MLVRVGASVEVAVALGEAVPVSRADGVVEGLAVLVAEDEAVAVDVGLGVAVAVVVAVQLDVAVDVPVRVAVEVAEGDVVLVGEAVAEADGEAEGVLLAVAVGVALSVPVIVAVGDGVGDGVAVPTQAANGFSTDHCGPAGDPAAIRRALLGPPPNPEVSKAMSPPPSSKWKMAAVLMSFA